MAKLNYTANVPDWQMYIIEIWRNSYHCPCQQQQVLKCPGTVPVCSMAQHHLLLKSRCVSRLNAYLHLVKGSLLIQVSSGMSQICCSLFAGSGGDHRTRLRQELLTRMFDDNVMELLLVIAQHAHTVSLLVPCMRFLHLQLRCSTGCGSWAGNDSGQTQLCVSSFQPQCV